MCRLPMSDPSFAKLQEDAYLAVLRAFQATKYTNWVTPTHLDCPLEMTVSLAESSAAFEKSQREIGNLSGQTHRVSFVLCVM